MKKKKKEQWKNIVNLGIYILLKRKHIINKLKKKDVNFYYYYIKF